MTSIDYLLSLELDIYYKVMELRQLRYFDMLAKTLSFSEASRKLYITQATLSQQIRQLEDELGHKLFERTSRKVTLTDQGEALLPLVQKTLEMSQQCVQAASDMRKELCGTLRVGVPFCFDEIVVMALKEFYKAHPKVKIVVVKKTAARLMEMLRAGMLDLVMAFKPMTESGDLQMKDLFSVQPHCIVRSDHYLAGRKSVTLADLHNYGLILPGVSHNARRSFDDFIKVDTSTLDVKMEIDEPEMLMDVVRATGLVGILAPVGLESGDQIRSGASPLLAIPIDGLDAPMTCCIIRLGNGLHKAAADAFSKILEEEVRFSPVTLPHVEKKM